MSKSKRKLNIKRTITAGVVVLLILYLIISFIIKLFSGVGSNNQDMFVASLSTMVKTYDEDFNEKGDITRGTKLNVNINSVIKDKKEKEYYKVKYNNKDIYVLKSDLVDSLEKTVLEDKIYIRTSSVVYSNVDSGSILGSIKKGSSLDVIGFLNILEDGQVDMYKVKFNDQEGYIYRKYVVFSQEEADAKYDVGSSVHDDRVDKYGGGNAGDLDY